jgi:fucose 4-O-acetylase-like acetyltransferase
MKNTINIPPRIDRCGWLDCLKGIGIICVVVGHVAPQNVAMWAYLFHMPLFFMASGFTHSSRNLRELARLRAERLLRPYFSYLLLFLLIPGVCAAIYRGADIGESLYLIFVVIGRFLLGGRFLVGVLGVFWFVTCLYLTQVLYCWLESKLEIRQLHLLAIFFLLLAYMNQGFLPSLMLPWNVNVVLFAWPLFHIGYMAKRMEMMVWSGGRIPWLLVVGILLCLLLIYSFGFLLPLDLKSAGYGIPILGLFAAIGCVYIVRTVAWQWADTVFGKLLGEVGQRSMTIMFVHQLVHAVLERTTNMKWIPVALISLIFPCLIHEILKRNKILCFYFLGDQGNR